MSLLRKTTCAVAAVAMFACFASPASAAEPKPKKPLTQYWVSAATQNLSIPGMSQGEMTGLQGMILGKMTGVGPKRTLLLQLGAPGTPPAAPEATHDIPPGLEMGKTLPLLIPERERPARGEEPQERKAEKPRARMLFYWGCGEAVRPGQPRVLDTEKMSMADFGRAMAGRSGSGPAPPSPRSGWAYAEWPNRQDQKDVPKSGSLTGAHFVHGNYSPEIKFSVGERHDFMAPVEFTSVRGGLADSIAFEWKTIPTAIGYFAMAVGHSEKTGETILWSSSDAQEPGYGLMGYLPPADVNRFIRDRVVMGPAVTSCRIPRGIFKEAGGAALQFIGYGDELNIAWPPKPKDPKIPHEYVWAVKLRNKSTGMLPLGQEGAGQEGATKEKQPDGERPGSPTDKMKRTLDTIRGLF